MHTNFPDKRETRCALAKQAWFENACIHKMYVGSKLLGYSKEVLLATLNKLTTLNLFAPYIVQIVFFNLNKNTPGVKRSGHEPKRPC